MKKAKLVTLLIVGISLLVSCSTTDYSYDSYTNMLPQRYVGWDDLERDQYDFVGNVVGTASFGIDEAENSVKEYHNYTGVLDLESYEGISSPEILEAVNQAIFAMTEKAYALGANFFILPNYSIKVHSDSDNYTVEVSVSAVAVRLIDRNGNDLKSY